MHTRGNIWLWALYDFANSLVSIVFFLYFAQWVVIDQGISDFKFNMVFTVTALLLFLTIPITGFLLDRSLRRITGLRYITFATILFYGLTALCAVNVQPLAALIFFGLGLYSFLLSFTFYTPLLNDIATTENRGRVSGLGILLNYSGQFLGLILVLPFSIGVMSWFGGLPRAETLLPSVVLFCITAVPMLIFFKEPKKERKDIQFISEVKGLFRETQKLLFIPGVFLFLLAYFLFNDAIVTASNNFSIFLERVWQVSDVTKTYIMAGILITSGVGGLCGGIVADWWGHKKTLVVILFGWVILLPLIGLLTQFTIFVVTTTIMGFWYGALWAVSRSFMGYLAPRESNNLVFGYFGLAERASSVFGSIIWGIITTSFLAHGSDRYRIAMVVMTVFVLFGLSALVFVRSDTRNLLR